MLKRLKAIIVGALMVACVLPATACDLGVQTQASVVGIEKTATTDLVDVYTITYSDGTTSTFEVRNGKDGEDGDDITMEEIFAAAVNNGYEGDYLDFLNQYFSNRTDVSDAALNHALMSAVSIYAEFPIVKKEPIYEFSPYYGYRVTGYEEVKSISASAGSGVIYKIDQESGDAYVITNYHVVYSAGSATENGIGRKLVMYLYGSENKPQYVKDEQGASVLNSDGFPSVNYGLNAIECEYVGGSMTYDLAVLKVSAGQLVGTGALETNVGNSGVVGESAHAIGNPNAEGISVTSGIVSVDSEYITMTGADDNTVVTFRVMRIDTPINSGNSGGGLFDRNGNLIGIVNAKVVSTSVENIAYAIPVDIVTGVVDNIIDNCDGNECEQASKFNLGIDLTTENSHAEFDIASGETRICETVLVKGVEKNSIAARLGLSEGDKIDRITLGEQTISITRTYMVSDVLLSVRDGMSVMIEVSRNGESKVFTYIATSDDFVLIA